MIIEKTMKKPNKPVFSKKPKKPTTLNETNYKYM